LNTCANQLRGGEFHARAVRHRNTEHVLDGFGPVQQKSLCVIDADLTHALKNLGPIDELGDSLDAHHARNVNETAGGGVVPIAENLRGFMP